MCPNHKGFCFAKNCLHSFDFKMNSKEMSAYWPGQMVSDSRVPGRANYRKPDTNRALHLQFSIFGSAFYNSLNIPLNLCSANNGA